ncbi:MAG: hypothetical protein ACT4RN_05205 [Pseudonocardia sp.]
MVGIDGEGGDLGHRAPDQDLGADVDVQFTATPPRGFGTKKSLPWCQAHLLMKTAVIGAAPHQPAVDLERSGGTPRALQRRRPETADQILDGIA